MLGFVESAKIIKPYCLIFEKFIVLFEIAKIQRLKCKILKIEI